jgi:hypothetical protein
MSPTISFSELEGIEPFWKLILRRQKTRTVRKPRKRPIKSGDILYLYWKQRVPKNKKPIHLIATAKCTKVERLQYKDFAYDDAFSRADGFKDHKQLQELFGPPEKLGSVEYDVIHWKIIDE